MSDPTDLTDLTILEAAEALHRKRLGAVELAQAYLARIERLNPELNAYVTVTAERALADARRADDAIARGLRGPATRALGPREDALAVLGRLLMLGMPQPAAMVDTAQAVADAVSVPTARRQATSAAAARTAGDRAIAKAATPARRAARRS